MPTDQTPPPVGDAKCESCGSTDAYWMPCPYTLELHDREDWCWLCDDCAHERRMDV